MASQSTGGLAHSAQGNDGAVDSVNAASEGAADNFRTSVGSRSDVSGLAAEAASNLRAVVSSMDEAPHQPGPPTAPTDEEIVLQQNIIR